MSIRYLPRLNAQFKVTKVVNLYLLLKLRKLGNKSQNILDTKRALNFSGWYIRIQPSKLTNHSARTVVTEICNKFS